MARLEARIKSLLLRRFDRRGGSAAKTALFDEGGEFWIDFCSLGRERMIGRERKKFGAKQSIGPRRINFDVGYVQPRLRQKLETQRKPLRAADPIGLHQADFFRPARKVIERA